MPRITVRDMLGEDRYLITSDKIKEKNRGGMPCDNCAREDCDYCGDFTILRHNLLAMLCHELEPHFEATKDMIIIDCKERIPKCQERQK